jgi:DNA-binding transcriptional ArsR family regulator
MGVPQIMYSHMAIHYASSMDRTFHALGNDSRREIVRVLSIQGTCNAGYFVDHFQSSQPTISKHLRALEEAGLVARHVEGRQHLFTLRGDPLKEALAWIEGHLSLWQSSLDRLERYLDAQERDA